MARPGPFHSRRPLAVDRFKMPQADANLPQIVLARRPPRPLVAIPPAMTCRPMLMITRRSWEIAARTFIINEEFWRGQLSAAWDTPPFSPAASAAPIDS